MPRLTIRHALFCAAALAAVPAQAATVFDQGPVFNEGDGVRSVFRNADDFTLAAAATLTGATFYLVQDTRQGPNFYNPAINFELFADLNGAPGLLLQSGSAIATRTATGLPPYAGISYLQFFAWAFDFTTPLTALANTRYWIGVQQSDDVTLGILSGGANPGASAQIGTGPGGSYQPRGFGLAFSVQGSAITAEPGAVPEPATWGMMLLGFGGVGYAMRRRPKVSARIRFA